MLRSIRIARIRKRTLKSGRRVGNTQNLDVEAHMLIWKLAGHMALMEGISLARNGVDFKIQVLSSYCEAHHT